MNVNYKKIWKEILKHNKITICTHVSPDGDTIGSAFALKHMILEVNPNAQIKISGEKVPYYLESIDDSEYVNDDFFNQSQVIVVDTSTKSRISDKRVKTKEALNLDHHKDDAPFKMRIGGDNWPATGQVLFEMSKELNIPLNKKSKKGIFFAIWTDTEGLTQRNISKTTYTAIKETGKHGIRRKVLKKLKLSKEAKILIKKLSSKVIVKNNLSYLLTKTLVKEDFMRPLIAKLSNDSKTEVFCAIVKDEKNVFRGEIRSKGNINVSIFAKEFGGGGHFASSGFSSASFIEANNKINKLLKKLK